MNNLDGIIFDLEGTLVTLPIDYSKLYADIKADLEKAGYDCIIDNFLNVIDLAEHPDIQIRNIALWNWHKAELEALPIMEPNNMGLMLFRRYEPSIDIAIVTLQSYHIAYKMLSQYAIRPRYLYTRNVSLHRKEQLDLILKDTGWDKQQVMFYGDLIKDQKAAIDVGIRFKLIKSKWTKYETTKKEKNKTTVSSKARKED